MKSRSIGEDKYSHKSLKVFIFVEYLDFTFMIKSVKLLWWKVLSGVFFPYKYADHILSELCQLAVV